MANTTNDKLPMTIRGKGLLEAELKRLLLEERPSVILAIEEARAQGDISENAEYEAAKERQSMIEGRIADIQGKLAGAEVVDTAGITADRIVFGAHVSIVDTETEEEVSYQIVGVDEADVKQSMISILSPLARALIGKKVGDTATVQSPKGDKEFEILAFKYK
jgi:transcription elongation factor GreA